MKIDLKELTRKGEVARDGDVHLDRIASAVVDVESLDEVHVHVHATYQEPLAVIDGTLQTVVHYSCSRCLTVFERSLSTEFQQMYTTNASRADDDIRSVEGEEIDLTSDLEESIFLALDERPLCKNDCLGLCPSCGINRNESTCNCETRTVDPRLEALRGLLSDGSSE